jgi:hypothetical protein
MFSLGRSRPQSIATGNFNSDNFMDIVVANYGTLTITVSKLDIAVDSTGANSLPCCIALGDLNSDGQLDIAVANCGTNNVNVLFGYHSGTFEKNISILNDFVTHPQYVAIADFDNDTSWSKVHVAKKGKYKLYSQCVFASKTAIISDISKKAFSRRKLHDFSAAFQSFVTGSSKKVSGQFQ